MTAWVLALASVTAISLVSLLGVTVLVTDRARVNRRADLLVAFAAGALLGDAFIHLLPTAFAGEPAPHAVSLLVLAGMLLFFAVEKLLRHQHGALHRRHHPGAEPAPPLVAINLAGDALHNFLDGVLIGASYLAGPRIGAATTLAVLLHEIPQELGDFGVLVHGGLSPRRAVLLNLASASTAVLGVLAALLLAAAAADVAVLLIPIAAGAFVYIAAANLIPELQHERGVRPLAVQLALMSLGIGVMAALAALE
jgi:zinc and cadmium transporter